MSEQFDAFGNPIDPQSQSDLIFGVGNRPMPRRDSPLGFQVNQPPPGGGGSSSIPFVDDLFGIAERGLGIATRIKNLRGGGGSGGGSGGGTTALVPGTPIPQDPCPSGIRIAGICVNPGDVFPGGDPLFTGAGGRAVEGAFGLPAITPINSQRVHRICPTGMILGDDNLCYPKAVLPRSSRFRKWHPGRKPLFTGGDLRAIRRAERLKEKAKKLAGDLGFTTKRRR